MWGLKSILPCMGKRTEKKHSGPDEPIKLLSVRRLSEDEIFAREKSASNVHKVVTQKRPDSLLRGNWPNPSNPKTGNEKRLTISAPICDTDSKVAWNNDKRHSHLSQRSSLPTTQAEALFSQLKAGNIQHLAGKGIMASTTPTELKTLPFSIDHIQSDRLKQQYKVGITDTPDGIKYYHGDSVTSSEIIPGSPLGQCYHSSPLPKDIHILELDNGSQGTFGFSFNLSDIEDDKPILIHGAELSGCSVAFARKGNQLFAFHTGQRENEKHKWTTATQGAASLKQSAEQLLQQPKGNDCRNNQELAIWMSKQFDQSALIYCGDGNSIVGSKNMGCFGYNSKTGDESPRVGNAAALLTKHGNEWRINVLGDDMKVDNTSFETTSLGYQAFKLSEY